MEFSGKALDILYAGTLPPHRGGSAISGSQLMIELSNTGHDIRCLGAITPGELKSGDRFSKKYPDLHVTRFLLPFFETSPDIPPPVSYRKTEGDEIKKNMVTMIENKKPDIILAGRETYAWHVPDIAIEYSVPCILRTAGSTTNGILNKTIPEDSAAKLIAQYKKFDLLISPAKHLERSIKTLGVENIITIINAVDSDKFYPEDKDTRILSDLQINSSDFIAGHISNMKSIKRPFDIVDSAEIILKDYPHIIFLIVGDGNCLEEMKQRCRSKKIFDNFRFTGWLDYDLVPKYLNLFDLFIMPSSAEGLARVTLEAQACGKCLIASDIAPTHEVINHGETGLIFRLGDVRDLTEKILLAYRDDELRVKIGSNARKRIHQHSIKYAAVKYVKVFREVIDNRKIYSSATIKAL